VELERAGEGRSWADRFFQQFLRQTLEDITPQLLLRSCERRAPVIADNCNLHGRVRAHLRASLLKFPGRVRWVAILPHTSMELKRRRCSAGTHAPDDPWGAALPGRGEDMRVEYGEGRDSAIFDEWKKDAEDSGEQRHGVNGPTLTVEERERFPDTACFFAEVSCEGEGFLSIGGNRRL